MKITLRTIRDAQDFEQLKPCIQFLVENMQDLSWGEFNSFRSVILETAKRLNIEYSKINQYAEQMQVYGYEVTK